MKAYLRRAEDGKKKYTVTVVDPKDDPLRASRGL